MAVVLLRFVTAVKEVFDVPVLPGRRYPDLIHNDDPLLANSFLVPEAAQGDVPAVLRPLAQAIRGAAGRAGSKR
jgi:hypothetical protein